MHIDEISSVEKNRAGHKRQERVEHGVYLIVTYELIANPLAILGTSNFRNGRQLPIQVPQECEDRRTAAGSAQAILGEGVHSLYTHHYVDL